MDDILVKIPVMENEDDTVKVIVTMTEDQAAQLKQCCCAYAQSKDLELLDASDFINSVLDHVYKINISEDQPIEEISMQ